MNADSLSRGQSKPVIRQSDQISKSGVTFPSIKNVTDFSMHLYRDLNAQPSTVEGYCIMLVDYLGPQGSVICQIMGISRLLASFQRDRSKCVRNNAKWNLVYSQMKISKRPFDPLKDSSLKYFTLRLPSYWFFLQANAVAHSIHWRNIQDI